MSFSIEEQEKLNKKLKEKGALKPCEACGKAEFLLLDTATHVAVHDLKGKISIPGTTVPSAALICKNCGNIRLHALGALGMIPKDEKEENAQGQSQGK